MSGQIASHGEFPAFQGSIEFVPAEGIAPSSKLRELAPPDLLIAVKGMEANSFLLLDEAFTSIAADPPASEAQFSLWPDLGRGREASAHGVVFGELMLASEDNSVTEFVAVKPFDTAKDAVREYGAIDHVNRLHPNGSRPLSLEPLGFFHGENGQVSLITAYDQSIRTWDRVFWDPNHVPSTAEVRRALGQSAYSLAAMHDHLSTHGDAQVKNMGADRRGVRYVDLETFSRFQVDDGSALHEAVERDLGTFLSSLNGGITTRQSDYTEAVASHFVAPYIRITQSPLSSLPESAQMTGDQILSLYSPNQIS
ncbi:MAG TPA: hypothetical protein VLH38_03195 [Patescibacteria group bacterium]|nr:hypothetical protein [Patescibacteria group bacterium]